MAKEMTVGTEGVTARLASMLLSATANVTPSGRNPFDGFGVLAMGDVPGVQARPKAAPVANAFDVQEARSRLVDFIQGTFKPSNLIELGEHLRQRLMRLELRVFDGKSVNYLVDLKGRGNVPAATVDMRLSRPGVQRLFGHAPVETLSPEVTEARNLRARAAAHFVSLQPNGTPFGDWQEVAFMASSMFPNREVTFQGDEAWIGVEYARASSDPARNRALVAQARAEGHKLILPAENRAAAEAGDLVPNMPIVIRGGAIRAKLVDRSLSFATLSKALGGSPFAHFREAAAKGKVEGAVLAGPTKVVDLDRFRRGRPAAEAHARAPAAPASKGAPRRGAAARSAAEGSPPSLKGHKVKHELDMSGHEVMVFVDPRTEAEAPFDVREAPAGRYQKIDAFGLSTGWLEVTAEGGLIHRDEMGRDHNDWGPAVVPPERSGRAPSFALGGDLVSRSEFERRSKGGVKDAPARDDRHEDRAPGMRLGR